jgi:hypothetical protein
MLSSVRAGEGYGGRFTGGPLLEALQPLLKLQAQPMLPPPKVEARRRGKGSGGRARPPGRGGGRPEAAQRGARGTRGARQRTVRRRTR